MPDTPTARSNRGQAEMSELPTTETAPQIRTERVTGIADVWSAKAILPSNRREWIPWLSEEAKRQARIKFGLSLSVSY